MPMKRPVLYIMANKRNGTLYTGVTTRLVQRVGEHKQGLTKGFTSKYGCTLLVYYEPHEDMLAAIAREKQIKSGSRAKKLALIEVMNPDWRDLYEAIGIARRASAVAVIARRRSRRGNPANWIVSPESG